MTDHAFPVTPSRRATTARIAWCAVAAVMAIGARAADITVQPVGGSGFVVKDSAGTTDRLRVQDNGQVSMPAVPAAATQAQNLCIGATGTLGPCTAVTSYSAGTGMSLSASTFSIAPTFQLPQACAANQVAQWNGSAWGCGSAGSSYGAGAGMALTGTTFSVAPSYQLPQACNANQVPQWTGTTWTCATLASGGGGGGLSGAGSINHLAKWSTRNALGDSLIFDDGTGVGIGTAAPANTLQVGVAPGFSGNQLALGNGRDGMSFFLSAQSAVWYSDLNFALMPTTGNGHLGIGRTNPGYHLDVLGANPALHLQDSVSNATATLTRYTNRLELSPSDAFQVSVGGLANPHFWIGSNGRVGIGTTAPQGRLQLGSLGNAPFGGFDIGFGNGTQASAISQGPTVASWLTTTDIALLPRTAGGGRVGINTAAPHAPLEVNSSLPLPETFNYFKYANGPVLPVHACNSCVANVSIWASDNVMALEFDTRSDARIKDIAGVSDSRRDLATLDALQVTDYTMKDKARNGDRRFKKVIAQQVESVYPQVVAKHTEFIPNVYQAASSVRATARGTLLHFDHGHHLTPGARRVRLLVGGEHAMQAAGVVAIPSELDVVVDLAPLGARVFVYGEEVDDFRTVDYEGLTALNISATQELGKELARQRADMAARIAAQDGELAALRAQLATQQARAEEFAALVAEMAQVRAELATLMRSAAPVQLHTAALPQ